MPIEYSIHPDPGIVHTVYSGPVRARDILGFQDRLRNDPAFDPAMDEITDLRGADLSSLTRADIMRIAHGVPFGESARIAMIAESDLCFGLARMFGSLVDRDTGARVRVFRDPGAADDWIDARVLSR